MKKLLLTLILFFATVYLCSQNTLFQLYDDGDALKKHSDELIADIEKEVKSINPAFSFNGLTTEISETFIPGHYRPNTNRIYYCTWPVAKPAMADFSIKAVGSMEAGDQLAAHYFFGYFLAHEIGHAMDFNTGKIPDNRYDSEYYANVFAMLYWRCKGRDKELQKCYEIAKNALTKLKDPVQAGTDRKKFVTENYAKLTQDHMGYAYILFSQIVEIMEDKSLPDFKTYMKEKYFK